MDVLGKEELEGLFRAAIAAVDPGRLVRDALRVDARGVGLAGAGPSAFAAWSDVRSVIVVGGGKAGRAMGEAAVAALGERVSAGAVAVPRGTGGSAGPVRFSEAAHPLPDEGSRAAAAEMLALLAGGETTVGVRGGGQGGRSQEFALAAALAIDGARGVAVLSAGTDGVDGPTDAAGAFADGATCGRARAAGLSPERSLAGHDSHPFFRALSGLVVTGPAGTNAGDVALGVACRAGSPP